jgi:hypothetical protein
MPEIDCNKTAMDLLPVTSAVFLIANFGKTWVSRRNIGDTSATPLGIKREWYVCILLGLFLQLPIKMSKPC